MVFLAIAGHGHVTLTNPEGGEKINGGSIFTIAWDADDHNCVYNLYFSPDSGENWSVIVLDLPQTVRSFKWTVPDENTDKGVIRILQDNMTGSDLDDRSTAFQVLATSGVGDIPAAPADLSLEFQPDRAVVALDLVRTAKVQVDAFDAHGRLVATLLKDRLASGKHQFYLSTSGLPTQPLIFKVRIGEKVRTFRRAQVK